MSECWDAIVVGAGPAGSALSIRLAEAGVRVLLLDRARFPRDKLCGEFLSPECWPMLHQLGAGDSIRGSGYQPIRRLRLRLPTSCSVEAVLPHAAECPAVGLSRHRLDDVLIRRAAAAGVAIDQNVQVIDLVRRGEAVVGVRARPAERSTRRAGTADLFAKVVVAADGRGSRVVRASGRTHLKRRSTPGDVCAVKRHFRVAESDDPGDGIELHSYSGGYAGTCRVESGVVNLCTLLPIAIARQARGNIDRALQLVLNGSHLARWLKAAEPISGWKTVAEIRVEQSQPELAGVLYVGDAMGTIDPLGGEGMTMALEGALLADRFVQQAITSRSGCNRRLQQRYQSAWLGRFARRIEICRSFSWLLARPALLGPLLPAVLNGAWTRALLPLFFRATRGRPDAAAQVRTT